MITEDYVSFETAKLLKGKGFNEGCLHYYAKEDFLCITYQSLLCTEEYLHNSEIKFGTYKNCICTAPTLQTAMKWLRKEKGIAIIPILSSILDNEKFLWDVKIVVAKTGESYSQGWIYEEQEEAFDTAIKYCLKNLI